MDKIENIANLPLFRDFSLDDLGHLSSIVADLSVTKGQMIFSEGDEANGF